MTPKRAAIVVTTIFEPAFLSGYLENLDTYGRRDSADLFVIVDRKTPATVAAACAAARREGFRVHCPTLDEQNDFLLRFPSLQDRIPYDSDNRRNIGFLMALDSGAELLISIDDDNFCLGDSDFVGEHSVAGDEVSAAILDCSDGWFNIGTMLASEPGIEIHPRGFPYFARRSARQAHEDAPRRTRVAVNAGLWTSDPDVDAISRLAIAPRVSSAQRRPVFLGPRSWSPVNTQNTAVARDAIAAYYYVRMGFSLGGMSIDRYGDILSGYFLQKCVHSREEIVRIGSPVADHRRTPHNLFKDLYNELAGIVLLEDLLPWLVEARLSGGSYGELYEDLSWQLEERGSAYRGFIWDQGGGEFLKQTAGHMRAWLEAVRTIG